MIRINAIIADCGMKKKDIAKVIFPANRYAYTALRRVLNGKQLLDSAQLERLAAHLNCNVQNLFDNDWTLDASKNEFVFTKTSMDQVEYKAFLDMSTGKTRVFANELMHYETILHDKFITLTEYTHFLNKLIAEKSML